MSLMLSLAIVFTSSFILTYLVTPVLIRRMITRGITGKDMNKFDRPEVAEIGGISPILGISLGITISIFIATYLHWVEFNLTLLLAAFLTIILVGFIGVIDDLIGWRAGIRQWQHALFPVFAALPLMAVQAGADFVILPFIGAASLGVLYSLVLVPLGITGASNAFNMLAGFNGLETGLGIITIGTLSLIALLTGKTEALIIGLAVLGSLIAFFFYNSYPAKVFGGDSLTLMIGASLATISIIGNMEKIGLSIIALHWVELIFKAKHKFQSESFGIPDKYGNLTPDPKGGSLTHALMKQKRFTEPQLVLTILGLQLLIAITVFIMFYFKLF